MRQRQEIRILLAALLLVSWRVTAKRSGPAKAVIDAWRTATDGAFVAAAVEVLDDKQGFVARRLGELAAHLDVRSAHCQIVLDWLDALPPGSTGDADLHELFSGEFAKLIFEPLNAEIQGDPNFAEQQNSEEAADIDRRFRDPGLRFKHDETGQIVVELAELTGRDFRRVEVFFGTNRADGDARDHRARHFGNQRGDGLRLGKAVVTLPLDHEEGQLERPWSFLVSFEEDRRLHVTVESAATLSRSEWVEAARSRGTVDGETFLFVHGYNVTFDEAMRRTGQLAYDLKLTGMPLCFSWASAGKVFAYSRDEETSAWSCDHLVEFLRVAMQELKLERLHVVAHSMGNRVLTEALRRLADHDEPLAPIDQVVLAAPDVDTGLFVQRSAVFPRLNGVTMYASRSDWAIRASVVFHDGPRASDAKPPLVLPHMETVDVTGVAQAVFDLGHGYIASAAKVFRDLFEVLHHKTPAARRAGIRLAKTGGYYLL